MTATFPELDIPEATHFWRWSKPDYERLVREGFLTASDRVEFLDGYLVKKMSQNPPHRSSLMKLHLKLMGILPVDWLVMNQAPIELSGSFPEPDLMVVRGPLGAYDSRHPASSEVGIVIEVSDTTLSTDRGLKKKLYAESIIEFYWVVNLPDLRIEVYSDPSPQGYGTSLIYLAADEVPVMLDGAEVGRLRVVDLLP
jgi:hypothetical protein